MPPVSPRPVEFAELFRDFVENQREPYAFLRSFYDLFAEVPLNFPPKEYDALEWFFYRAAEPFTGDPDFFDPEEDIDEPQLRAAAVEVFQVLDPS